MIDSNEGREVHIFEVLGSYLNASLPVDKVLHMEFEGEFVDIMCEVNPEYEKSVIYDKGKKVLCVMILKVVYGMI